MRVEFPPSPDPEEKIKHIEAVLNSAVFRSHDRLRKVLEIIWEMNCRGETATATAISEFLHGKGGFENAVRGNVSSLRERLSLYYSTEGRDSALRIEVPKGRYRIEFVPNEAAEGSIGKETRTRVSGPLLIGAAVLIGAIVIVFSLFLGSDENPVQIKADGGILVVKNEKGRVLWRHRFLQLIRLTDYGMAHQMAVIDIDDDGRNEVAFHPDYPEWNEGNDTVFLFDDDGTPLWGDEGLKVGREMVFGTSRVDDSYAVKFVKVVRLVEEPQVVLINAAHHPDEPSVIAMVSLEGEILSEFWHYGHVGKWPYFHDLEGDGVMESFFGGINAEEDNAVLAVFSGMDISGKSPQTPGSDGDAAGLAVGSMRYYIRFPRNCLIEGTACREHAYVESIEDDIIRVRVGDSEGRNLFYFFDFQLNVREVKESDLFRMQYDELIKRRESAVSLEECLAALKKNVAFWDGRAYVKEPTIVIRRAE
jgi:hypothetical protein